MQIKNLKLWAEHSNDLKNYLFDFSCFLYNFLDFTLRDRTASNCSNPMDGFVKFLINILDFIFRLIKILQNFYLKAIFYGNWTLFGIFSNFSNLEFFGCESSSSNNLHMVLVIYLFLWSLEVLQSLTKSW